MAKVFNKPFIFAVVYYLVVVGAVVFFNSSPAYRSGPCNPGLDVISILFAFVITIGAIIRSVILFSKKGKYYLPALLLHVFIIVGIIAASLAEAIF